MPRLIGIDASRAVRSNRTGTENYSWYLIKKLAEIDQKNRYLLYAPHTPKEEFGTFPNVEWRILPAKRLWSQIQLAREVRQNPPDVLFVPSHVVPIFSSVRAVVTIHDLAYKYYPNSYTSFDRRYLNFSTGVSVSKASRVLTPSVSTKRDLLKEYQMKPDKVVVTPLGYNEDVFNPSADYDAPPIGAPYIYYVGRIEEKKNLGLLIDAFALLAKEIKSVLLVLAGKPGFGYENIQLRIQALPENIRKRIIQPGYFPLYDSARYLKHARVFAFPSYYEGFGMPVLEAMALGTPVVCSNTSSLPEVAGEAAILLPPTNPLSWAAAMSRIIHQPEHVAALREKGFHQVKNFSWQQTARQTLEVLVNVAGR